MGLFKRTRQHDYGSPPSPPGMKPTAVPTEPTLFPGRDPLEVKGESFYQESLRVAVGRQGREVTAVLVPEPNNQYDSNAVAVMVDGRKVGHLSREDAATYQTLLMALMQKVGTPIGVTGRIFGGEVDKPTFGIWLYHDARAFGIGSSRAKQARTV